MTRPVIASIVNAGFKSEVGGVPLGALLMRVLGFPVRTEAVCAISALLPLRLALDLAVDRFDFIWLGFLAMDPSVDWCSV